MVVIRFCHDIVVSNTLQIWSHLQHGISVHTAMDLYNRTVSHIKMYFRISAIEVFKKRFWMMLHGSKSPKPTMCWSNCEEILDALDTASDLRSCFPSIGPIISKFLQIKDLGVLTQSVRQSSNVATTRCDLRF